MTPFLRPAIWLISQFSLPRKLALVGGLFLVPLVVLAALLLPRLNSAIAFAERELVGIEAIQPIKNLTLQTQAHRGTIQLMLSGDPGAHERLPAIHEQAARSISELDAFHERHGSELNTNGSWTDIKFRWAFLQANTDTLPADKSFLLHSELAQALNAYLAKLGDMSGLILDHELPSYYLARIVLEQLPEMIENFGQTRALSAAAAQHQDISAVDRHQLSGLVGAAEKSEHAVLGQLNKVFATAPDLAADIRMPMQMAADASHRFIFAVQNQVLLPDDIHADGPDLYAAGSLAIDAAYRLCNTTLPLLKKTISDRKEQLTREKQRGILLTGLILALLAYLFIGFVSSFFQSLGILKNAANRVAQGDFDSYAMIDTHDELRDIATSFNSMTDALRGMVSQLRASENKYRAILEQAGDIILVTDLEGNLVDANRMAEAMLGYGREELLKMNVLTLTPASEQARAAAALARLAANGHYEEEHLVQHKDGHTIPVHAKCVLIEHGGNKLAMGIFRDISSLRESQQRIEFLATHDPLTSLPNRILLYDRIQHSIARAERAPGPFALLFIDLDNFKEINDSLGHDAGDELLQEAATRILSCVRTSDTAARLGGDEFTVLINAADRTIAAATAQRLIDELSAPFVIDRHEIRDIITASIGISLYPQDGSSRHAILKCADEAMYRAKAAGKNSYQFYSAS